MLSTTLCQTLLHLHLQIQLTLKSGGEIVADYFFAGEDTTPYTWFTESGLSLVSKGPNLFQCKY